MGRSVLNGQDSLGAAGALPAVVTLAAMSSIEEARDAAAGSRPGPERVAALNSLAAVLLENGEHAEALDVATEALAGARPLASDEVLIALYFRADSLVALRRGGEAVPDLVELLDRVRPRKLMYRTLFLRAATQLVNEHVAAGRLDEAAELAAEAAAVWRAQPDTETGIGVLGNLATVYERLGRTAEAARVHVDLLPLYREAGPRYEDALLDALSLVAVSYLDLGRADEAVALVDEAVERSRSLAPAVRSVQMTNRMVTLRKAGRLEAAVSAADEAIGYLRSDEARAVPNGATALAVALNDRAALYHHLGRHDEAVAAVMECVEHDVDLAAEDPDRHFARPAGSWQQTAVILRAAGRLDRALDAGREAVRISRLAAEREPDTGEQLLLNALLVHAQNLGVAASYAEGLPFAVEAVALARRLHGGQGADLEEALALAHDCHDHLDESAEAFAVTEQLVEVLRRSAEPDLVRYSGAANNLGFQLMKQGRLEDAVAVSAEAVEAGRRLGGDRLAIALWTFAEVRLAAGRELPEALAAIEESVALYEAAGLTQEAHGAGQMRTDVRTALAGR